MKRILFGLVLGLAGFSSLSAASTRTVRPGEPLAVDFFTPDPAPVVDGDTLWVFTGRDLPGNWFNMPGWQVLSTKDMKTWTNHGMVMDTSVFKWAKQGNDAWASQAIKRKGKWYWYVAANDAKKGTHGIGVATADSPLGPWTDPIGKPLVPGDWGFIDPSVFIDDDGQAWLFWGNNNCWYAPLNEDMVSFKAPYKQVPGLMDEKAFGPHKQRTRKVGDKEEKYDATNFEEAPWIYKRGDTYYLEYAAGGVPEHWAYSTAKSIHGPWTYRGKILGQAERSFTIHGGSVTFKGRNYCFYHNGMAPKGGGFQRSATFKEFTYNADGSIPFISMKVEDDDSVPPPAPPKPESPAAKAAYRNPVLYADVPDPSLCSDGKKYYLVSTTMHLVPGVPIMESEDLVHWRTVSYVLPRFEPGDYPRGDHDWGRYDFKDGRTAYGQGQWASTIRYHQGQFYVWFVCNGARGYLYTAKTAAGPWKLHARPSYMHDGGLFFDDDGKAYVFHGSGHVTQLKADLSDVDRHGLDLDLTRWTRTPGEKGLLEGSHVVKRGGYYYLLMISMDWSVPGRLRREVCYRAKALTGPYESKVILETPFEVWGGVGQGDLVERNGEWHALIFQDRGGVGRVPCLMPVRWEDDWPMLGDAAGRIPNDPSRLYPDVSGYVGSDDFSSDRLSLYWQWNHNPVDDAWSLAARPGWLRLTTARVVPNLFLAPNTLTQRMVGPACSGAVKLDVSGMKDGDRAGLAAFQSDSAVLAVQMENGRKRLVMTEEKSVFTREKHAIAEARVKEKGAVDLPDDVVWLRVRADFRPGQDWAECDWSGDGRSWQRLGSRLHLRFDYTRFFMGTKFALFNYATKTAGGHVDFDEFRFACEEHEPAP